MTYKSSMPIKFPVIPWGGGYSTHIAIGMSSLNHGPANPVYRPP